MKNTLQAIIPWIILSHACLFLLFWLTNHLFFSSTNDYLIKKTGLKLDFIGLFMFFAGILVVWSIEQILTIRLHWTIPLEALLFYSYIALSVLFVALFYGGFWILFQESPVQWIRIGQLIDYFRIFIDVILLLAAAFLIGLVQRSLNLQPGAGRWIALVGGIVAIIILWALPLFFLPGSVIKGILPPKPKIIAHRGASMLAPENTIASAEMAVELGVYGLETDLHLTRDGALVLMHDDTLKRTTNVGEVFPGREKERVENFSLAEIQKLNAGTWFLKDDPYQTIKNGEVLPAQAAQYQVQSIPLFINELDMVKRNHLVLIFDLKQPPDGHPYAKSFFDVCLKEVQQAHIDSQIWFLVDQAQLARIRAESPQMIAAIGLDYKKPILAGTIREQGYQLVNVEYGISVDWIRSYQRIGLWVNVYTVDEPWQFSRLWILGVDSVTTSNAKTMAGLTQPLFGLPFSTYVWIWGLVGLICLSIAIVFATVRFY